jgi:hypothetical protein
MELSVTLFPLLPTTEMLRRRNLEIYNINTARDA